MIDITVKEDCCGCGSCVQRCPKSCIAMVEDEEGFLYPKADESVCIDCGLCEQVCPIIHQSEERTPKAVYAAKNLNENIRRQSSSGGVFTILAEEVIQEGGVVFGARFDANWDIVHTYTETVAGLAAFRGSKYVQSRIGNSFQEAEQFLKNGRKILFSGTPCQIAGLHKFLRKEYPNLLTVDFICHGVPSPAVWREYLKEETARQWNSKNGSKTENVHIDEISFRNKRLGWRKFSFTLALSGKNKHGAERHILHASNKYHNPFLKGFLRDLYLRPACHHCCAKGFNSGSDITIADFWTMNKHLPKDDDAKGYSLLFWNRNNSCDLNKSCIELKELNIKSIRLFNSTIYRSPKAHPNRKIFFTQYKKRSVIKLIKQYATVSWKKKIYLLIAEMRNN